MRLVCHLTLPLSSRRGKTVGSAGITRKGRKTSRIRHTERSEVSQAEQIIANYGFAVKINICKCVHLIPAFSSRRRRVYLVERIGNCYSSMERNDGSIIRTYMDSLVYIPSYLLGVSENTMADLLYTYLSFVLLLC